MPNRAAWLVACIALAPQVHAQDIHKCRTASGVAYQSDPCPEGQAELAVLRAPASTAQSARAETRTASANPPPPTAQWMPFRRTEITLGVTDDEVLNTPRWGRPTRISRSRENGVWRESWIYSGSGGTRRLSFANGRLTNIESDAPAHG